MFNDRKYVFETTHTRAVRRFKSFIYFSVSTFLLYSLTCLIILLVSKQENEVSKKTFFNKTPDIIVVFTGDIGRIPYALKLSKELKQPAVLISGVNNSNHVDILLKDINTESQIDPNFLELDYRPKNTFENVLNTLEYLRESKGLKEILIVSHDYHILRIKALINQMRRNDDPFNFYYSGVNSDYSKINNIKKLYKEVFKFFRTLAFVSLADIE